jgi:glucose uptake protein GlcU
MTTRSLLSLRRESRSGEERMARSVGVVIAGVVLASMISDVAAVGCGEPLQSIDQGCTDRQCTRKTTDTFEQTLCVRGLPVGAPCDNDNDCYINLRCQFSNETVVKFFNSTGLCVKADSSQVAWQGYVAVAVAVLGFGSNFIPARKLDPGNGLYFQFFMSTAILCAGFIVQMVRGASVFYPYAMLGGMLWCIGNSFAMPALKLISMGLAISLWGGSNMMLGWASGHFGFWGVDKEKSEVEWIGYVGVAFAALGVIVLGFVKKSTAPHRDSITGVLIANDDMGYSSVSGSQIHTNPYERVELGEKPDITRHMSRTQMRVLGVFLALGAGCFFGVNFDPPTRLIDSYSERSLTEDVKYSPSGLDYVFSHFFGIFVTALLELVLFTAVDGIFNLPEIFTPAPYEQMILPGFISGLGWAIAQIAWFVANDNLGLVVSFPIVALGPSVVASLWSVFLFGEIRGQRNYVLLLVAFVLLGTSATCTVLAKNGF